MLKIGLAFILKPRLFTPTMIVPSFSAILPYVSGVPTKLIIFDKDDTLTNLHEFIIHDTQIKQTIESLKQSQIDMRVLSNSIKANDPAQI